MLNEHMCVISTLESKENSNFDSEIGIDSSGVRI